MNTKAMGISVIICSKTPALCERLKDCIVDTIGVEFEIIAFDNREKNWGLCKVYNYCAKNAVYPYLCFIHEDIIIATHNWGKILIDFAELNENCGVIGFLGGTAACRNVIGWWGDGLRSLRGRGNARYRIWDPRHGEKVDIGYPNLYYQYYNPDNVDFARVVPVDGLFLFVAQKVFIKMPFDEDTFSGFHCYDTDFTLGIAQIKQNYVCFKIDVYHFSAGTISDDFYKNVRKLQVKWRKLLPFTVNGKKITVQDELRHAYKTACECKRVGMGNIIKIISHAVRVNGYLFSCLFVFYYAIETFRFYCNRITESKRIRRLLSSYPGKRLTLWGCGLKGKYIAELMSKLGVNFEITDVNAKIHGKIITANTAVKPWSELKGQTDVVLVSAIGLFDEIRSKLATENPSIEVVDLIPLLEE